MSIKYALLLSIGSLLTAQPRSDVYISKNLISDLHAGAEHTDPHLVNAWGLASSPTGPFWIADNGAGLVTVYDAQGMPFPNGNPIVVTVPPPRHGTPPATPTGVVFNSTTGFQVQPGLSALFLFAAEDGTISGWNPMVSATEAQLVVDNSTSGAVYKGLATNGTNLYATNFFAGTVDVFDSSFMPVSNPGAFQDPMIPSGFAPFDIANINGKLWVTYAMQDADKHDDVAGPGNGFIDVFDYSGALLQHFAQQGELNSPWGLALAPSNFGAFSGALLVGNFGNGHIHAFNPESGQLLGELLEPSGQPLVIDGVWGLIFGNGGNGGDPGTLYFTAGPDDESHGLFGQIRPQHP